MAQITPTFNQLKKYYTEVLHYSEADVMEAYGIAGIEGLINSLIGDELMECLQLSE